MTKPEAVGMSSERLARIEHFLKERYVAPGKLVGTQTLVARKGKLVYSSVLGLADLSQRGSEIDERGNKLDAGCRLIQEHDRILE